MFNILGHEESTNQTSYTIRFHLIPIRVARIKIIRAHLARIWNKGNTHPLLIAVQTYTATLEINMTVPWKIGNQSISRYSCTTLGNIFKG